jgi:hypothetical protein
MASKEKDKFYFSHDSNARRDPKLIALRGKHGWAGYGRFFALVEILRETSEYKVDMTKSYILQSISSELDFSSAEEAEIFIKDCLDFELLETDSIFVWSNSLNARMEQFEKKRQRYRDMAEKRWGKNGKKEKNDSKKSEENKEVSKKKEAPYKSIECLRDLNQFKQVVLSELEKKDEFNGLTLTVIEFERKKCVDWLASKGKRQSNYRAFFFNWLRSYIEKNGLIGKGGSKEKMVY